MNWFLNAANENIMPTIYGFEDEAKQESFLKEHKKAVAVKFEEIKSLFDLYMNHPDTRNNYICFD